MNSWNQYIKAILKAELIKRGLSVEDLVELLNNNGIEVTKASVNSKICRGTFSATFLLQCLTVIGCKSLNIEIPENSFFNFNSNNKSLDVKKNKVY